MKSVLISIQPKWCELIANGKKTIELRRTRPKLATPFKVYIYCTKTKKDPHLYINNGLGRDKLGVIDHWWGGKDVLNINCHIPKCRYIAYMAEGKVIGEFVCDDVFERDGWHISDLKIYDKPRELQEFTATKKCTSCKDLGCKLSACAFDDDCIVPLTVYKAPQSWMYVEELQNDT